MIYLEYPLRTIVEMQIHEHDLITSSRNAYLTRSFMTPIAIRTFVFGAGPDCYRARATVGLRRATVCSSLIGGAPMTIRKF